ncbi:MAG TPA: response regulator [Ktedonobacteraceae bacterium]|nr:response regulator [Ktedonobacteraceae bacterium]
MANSKKRILIIDDEPDILAFLLAMFEDVGYTVVATERGDDVDKLTTRTADTLPDVILLDMLLSGSDGREIARKLKGQKETAHIPIIMTSAHPFAQQEAQESGADDFLAKPFDMDELLDIVAKYV